MLDPSRGLVRVHWVDVLDCLAFQVGPARVAGSLRVGALEGMGPEDRRSRKRRSNSRMALPQSLKRAILSLNAYV